MAIDKKSFIEEIRSRRSMGLPIKPLKPRITKKYKRMKKKEYGGGASPELKKLSIGLSQIKSKTK